jgi:drug/metabolite transporter (DMT)-like permease
VTTAPLSDAAKARLLLVALCLAWGLTWPAMRIALTDLPPFTMRSMSSGIGVISLLVLAWLAGRPVRVPPRATWLDLAIISFFNIIVFGLCTAFGQVLEFTGRIAIIVYTMPIWAALLARIFLHELLTPMRLVALILCCGGMAVLIYPLATAGIPLGLMLALIAAIGWAIGTIYMKWRRIDIEPFTLAAWQLVIAFVFMAAFIPFYEGAYRPWHAGWYSLAGVAFSGFFGSGLAYFLWFHIIRLMPATTASLGALGSPVIGVVSSAFLLGEIPTTADIIGFVLIFLASACALLQPTAVRKIVPDRA